MEVGDWGWWQLKALKSLEEFQKRLKNLVWKTKLGRQFGTDIEKYY